MRVISGIAKGVRLDSLQGDITRPTLDRVKEALFNILQNDIRQSQVLDLFSGSGALAIESLSRGAKYAVLCDKSSEAIKIIKRNLEKTKLEENAKIIKNDYKKALELLQKEENKFDIIFIDPPYKENIAVKAIQEILKCDLLNKEGIIVLETDYEERELEQLQTIDVNIYDLRKYGRVKLLFLNRKG